jgi:hypothetical protein
MGAPAGGGAAVCAKATTPASAIKHIAMKARSVCIKSFWASAAFTIKHPTRLEI